MDLKATVSHVEHFLRSNSPAILTGFGVTGVVTTAYLSWNAGYWTAAECVIYPESTSKRERIKHNIKTHWRKHIPAIVIGGGTVTCIVLATKISNRRTAAITAAYSITEKAFSEYKEKVKEKIGPTKEQKIRDEVVQDRVTATAPGTQVIFVGGGNVLCYEYFTGRYFLCDMETLKRAENEINAIILRCDYATLAEFQSMIRQAHTQGADSMGWTREKLLDLEFTSCLMDENRPALSFTYTNMVPL